MHEMCAVWDFTQDRMSFSYRRFGITCRISSSWISGLLTPHKIPKEFGSHPHHGGSLKSRKLDMLMFLRKHKDRQFVCGHNILTDGVSVTQLPSNAGISVWLIVWIATNCRFASSVKRHAALYLTIPEIDTFKQTLLCLFLFLINSLIVFINLYIIINFLIIINKIFYIIINYN
jgi:hypothetical protein